MTVGTCILLLLLTVGCLVYAAPIHTALAEGVFLCLQVILPSLYAMMIAAQLLIRTNAHTLLLKPLHRFTQNVLRIPDVCLAIFLLSQIGGYPIGAKLLDNELQKGTLTPNKQPFSPVFVLAAALLFSSERSPLRLEHPAVGCCSGQFCLQISVYL